MTALLKAAGRKESLGGYKYRTITRTYSACAIRSDKALFGWGGDWEGQLENGPPVSSEASPQLVIEPLP